MSDPMILLNLWIAASLALGVLWALGGLVLPKRRRARRESQREECAGLARSSPADQPV